MTETVSGVSRAIDAAGAEMSAIADEIATLSARFREGIVIPELQPAPGPNGRVVFMAPDIADQLSGLTVRLVAAAHALLRDAGMLPVYGATGKAREDLRGSVGPMISPEDE